MFVVNQTDSYKWPVIVELPIDGGKFKKENFDAEFKRVPQSRIKEIVKLVESDEMGDKELCKEVLVGWKGIQDNAGEELRFSETALDTILDIQGVAKCIVKAFFESISGVKIKN